MISYGKKEMEALALIEPINANNIAIDTEKYVRKAHELRSEFLADTLQKLVLSGQKLTKLLREKEKWKQRRKRVSGRT